MNTLKKTMFLTNNNNSLFILTLEKKNNNIFGTIKSYDNKITGDLILGIKCNEKIFKQSSQRNYHRSGAYHCIYPFRGDLYHDHSAVRNFFEAAESGL